MKNRKLIAAAVAVMAAASLSATDVYAAKADKADKKDKITFSGSTKTEYVTESDNGKSATKWKSEVKLNTFVKADDRTNVMLGLNYENKSNDTKRNEGSEIEFENLWVETKLNDNLWARFGSQSIDIGKGLTIDCDGVMGAKFSWNIDKNNDFTLFAGRNGSTDVSVPASTDDARSEKLNFINYTHKFDQGNVGAYYMRQGWNLGKDEDNEENDDGSLNFKEGKQKYWGIYSEYEIAPAVTVGAEFVKNTFTSEHGFVAELEFGKAKNVGEWKYTLTYIDAPQYLYPTEDYTNYDDQVNVEGYKGFGVLASTRISKAAVLNFEHYWGDTNLQSGKNYDKAFTEVKLATKF